MKQRLQEHVLVTLTKQQLLCLEKYSVESITWQEPEGLL